MEFKKININFFCYKNYKFINYDKIYNGLSNIFNKKFNLEAYYLDNQDIEDFYLLAIKLMKKHKIFDNNLSLRSIYFFYNDLYIKWNKNFNIMFHRNIKHYPYESLLNSNNIYTYLIYLNDIETFNLIKSDFKLFKHLFSKNKNINEMYNFFLFYDMNEINNINTEYDIASNYRNYRNYLYYFFNSSCKNVRFLCKRGYRSSISYFSLKFLEMKDDEILKMIYSGIDLRFFNYTFVELYNNEKIKEKIKNLDNIIFKKMMFYLDYSLFDSNKLQIIKKIIYIKLGEEKSRELNKFMNNFLFE